MRIRTGRPVRALVWRRSIRAGERARPEGARLAACRYFAICGGQHPIHYGCERSDVASELGLHVAGHFDGLDVRGDRAPPVALGRDIG